MARPSGRVWAWPWSQSHGRGARSTQHHVESVAEGDAFDAVLEVEVRDQEPPPRFGNAVEDRIDGQQRVAWEEHLRDQALGVGVAEEREVDVGRAPREGVVLPR